MSKERTVLLRTTSFSVEAGEAAVGARPATVASDEKQQSGEDVEAIRPVSWMSSRRSPGPSGPPLLTKALHSRAFVVSEGVAMWKVEVQVTHL